MMTAFSIYANASAQDTQRETKQRDLKEADSQTCTKPDSSVHVFAHEDLSNARCNAAQRFPQSEQISAPKKPR